MSPVKEMNLIQRLSAVFAGAVILAGCGQEPSAPAAPPGGDAPAEPPTVTSKDFGDYVLHFNSLTTDQLQQQVARQYGIVRSKNRALLTVSILRKVTGTPGKPVAGQVIASAKNLTGQLKQIEMREIRDGDSIYYIADLPVANSETLIFDVAVIPEGTVTTMNVRFSRQYFTD